MRSVVCSKQWRIKSEIIEKQRSVTQLSSASGAAGLWSRTTMVARAMCVLERSRSNLLACWADSTSGVQITRLRTLVRTCRFAPVRILSADIFHSKERVVSTSSMRTCLPAQGKRFTGPPAILLAIPLSFDLNELHCPHPKNILCDDDAEKTYPGQKVLPGIALPHPYKHGISII